MELVTNTPGLYSVMGPYSMSTELQSGRLQASKLVKPDLVRHVTLALPRHGKLSAACRVVAMNVEELIEAWENQLTGPAPKAATGKRKAMRRRPVTTRA